MAAWWIIRYAPNGRGFMVDIPFRSEHRAERYLETKYNGQGKVLQTNSSDKRVAAQELRERISELNDPNLQWGKNFKHGK